MSGEMLAVAIAIAPAILALAMFFLMLPVMRSKTVRLFYMNYWRKKPILVVIDSSMRAKIRTCDYDGQMLKTNNGRYLVSPNSVYLLGSVPLAIAYDRFAATLPHKLVLFSQKATDSGVEDLDEAERKDFRVDMLNGETLRVQDVVRFFRYDLNPSLLNAAIERIEAMAFSRALRKTLRIQYFSIGLMFFMICLGIATLMAVSGGEGGRLPPW